MTELFIVIALIALNGLFALSELAVVSAKPSKLRSLAAAGRSGATDALALASDPGRFLSGVQIGITLIGLVNGAYSGETFGEHAANALKQAGVPENIAAPAGYGGVILIITYLSVIVGELVPKNIALRNAEGIACLVAPAMKYFARFAFPAVWVLDTSTKFVFRLFGNATAADNTVTDDELKSLIADAESAGVIEKGERHLISGVMRLSDRAVRGLMTPRTDVDWVDVLAPAEQIQERLISTQHSRLPAAEGSLDQTLGVVQSRELFAAMLRGEQLDVRAHIRRAPVIPENLDALDALTTLREAEVPMALIHDEYGHFRGLVSPADILEAIAGAFRSDTEGEEPYAVERDNGSWLLSGAMPVDEMADTVGIVLPATRQYQTVAGFVLAHLHHLPKVGEHAEVSNWRFEVVDLDGRRIDKVLATRLPVSRRDL